MMKLNGLQMILLSSAAQRDDGSLYPLPASIADAGARLDKGIAALIKNGLTKEREANNAAQFYRSNDQVAFGLFVTEAGRAAIGVGGPDLVEEPGSGPVAVSVKPSKTSTIIALLQRPEGATLEAMIAATGWLPHTTRAALTGLRKKGHTITKVKVDGVTTYSIAPTGDAK